MYFRYLFYFFRRTFFIFLLGTPLQQNGHNYINTCPFDPGGGSKFQPRHTASDSNASITTIREKWGRNGRHSKKIAFYAFFGFPVFDRNGVPKQPRWLVVPTFFLVSVGPTYCLEEK